MKTKQVIDHIVHWLNVYAEKSKTRGFVVGISGGIDSAVTSTLCAMTGKEVWLLEMPIYQAASQVDRAQEHIAWLEKTYPEVHSERIELTAAFDAFMETLPPVNDAYLSNLALANTRARMRMTTLYYIAGIRKLLVAGTGNKIEDFGVGFFTKYGDGGVDLSPIADLTKTEVYEIAESLGIATSIRIAAPTDGLWGDDRTDEDQIGASYPELEWAMEYAASNSGSSTEHLTERQKEVLEIYLRLNRANQHKMIPIPVCDIPKELKAP